MRDNQDNDLIEDIFGEPKKFSTFNAQISDEEAGHGFSMAKPSNIQESQSYNNVRRDSSVVQAPLTNSLSYDSDRDYQEPQSSVTTAADEKIGSTSSRQSSKERRANKLNESLKKRSASIASNNFFQKNIMAGKYPPALKYEENRFKEKKESLTYRDFRFSDTGEKKKLVQRVKSLFN